MEIQERSLRYPMKNVIFAVSATLVVSTILCLTFDISREQQSKSSLSESHLRKLTVEGDFPIDLGIDTTSIPEEQRARLPTTAEVTDLYGPEPVILGLDRCSAFREAYPPEDRFMSIAGLYNTGTNFLFDTLSKNCVLPGREESFNKYGQQGEVGRGILSGVHWGKHSPLSMRPSHVDSKFEGRADFARFNSMPLVVVKDPVFWMASMCKRWYDVNSIQSDRNWYDRCPYLAADDFGTSIPISGKLLPWNDEFHYDSLVDLWNSFYSAYEQFDAPRLMIRYEDLIFHGDHVVRDICSCAGGEMTDFSPSEESTKANVLDQEGNANGLVKSAILYGSKEQRDEVFQVEKDRVFAEKHLDNSLMEKLNYQPPTEPVVEKTEWKPKIPHTIWFIGEQEIVSELHFENAIATSNAYKEAWGEMEAPINFLNNEDCAALVEEMKPGIKDLYESDSDKVRRVGICKVAALYKYGGYYFSTDVKTVEPFQPRDDLSFVGPLSCGEEGCLLSSAFTASAPGHPLLEAALEEFAVSYALSDLFDASLMVQKKMVQAYHSQLSDEEKMRGVQLLDEVHLESVTYASNYENVGRQMGRGDCNVVISDPKKDGLILFFSHFIGSQNCRPGLIPRQVWLSHDNSNAVRDGQIDEHNENVARMVEEYRSYWNEPDMFVDALNDDTCLEMVKEANEELVPYFEKIQDANTKHDICRLATMLVHGGLFLGSTPKDSDDYFIPSDDIEFVATSEINGGSFSSKEFAAAIPQHPVVRRAVNMILNEIKQNTEDGNPPFIIVSALFAKAFHSLDPRFRGQVVLLTKGELSEPTR